MLISQAEWARTQGFSRQYVNKLVKNGTIRLIHGKVDPEQAARDLEPTYDPARPLQRKGLPLEAAAAPGAPSPATGRASSTLSDMPAGDVTAMYQKARLKCEMLKAKLLENREKVETGKLIDAEEVEKAAFDFGRSIRAAWEAWPNRVAGPMGAELGIDMRIIRSVVEKYVREHLTELADRSAIDA